MGKVNETLLFCWLRCKLPILTLGASFYIPWIFPGFFVARLFFVLPRRDASDALQIFEVQNNTRTISSYIIQRTVRYSYLIFTNCSISNKSRSGPISSEWAWERFLPLYYDNTSTIFIFHPSMFCTAFFAGTFLAFLLAWCFI